MTDDRDDERLRAALHAEARGVEADPRLLDRIHGAASGGAADDRHRGRWIAVAASIALVALGLAAVMWPDDDDRSLLVDSPPATTGAPTPSHPMVPLPSGSAICTEETDLIVYLDPAVDDARMAAIGERLRGDPLVAAVTYVDRAATYAEFQGIFSDDPALVASLRAEDLPTSYRVTLEGDPPLSRIGDLAADLQAAPDVHQVVVPECPAYARPAPMPTLVALVRDDGWLVTLDLETGEERELVNAGDPDDLDQHGIRSFIDDVELSPDGQWVYFSTCCEPAIGSFYRIAVDAPDPEVLTRMPLGTGASPRISPDGRYIASGGGSDQLFVVRLDDDAPGVEVVEPDLPQLDGYIVDLSWSPDGRSLAVVQERLNRDDRFVDVFSVVDDEIDRTSQSQELPRGGLVGWRPDGTLATFTGEPYGGKAHVHQDASYQWQLASGGFEGLRILHEAHIERGEPTILEEAPPAIAADW